MRDLKEIADWLCQKRIHVSFGDVGKCIQQVAELTDHVGRLTSAIESLRGEVATSRSEAAARELITDASFDQYAAALMRGKVRVAGRSRKRRKGK